MEQDVNTGRGIIELPCLIVIPEQTSYHQVLLRRHEPSNHLPSGFSLPNSGLVIAGTAPVSPDALSARGDHPVFQSVVILSIQQLAGLGRLRKFVKPRASRLFCGSSYGSRHPRYSGGTPPNQGCIVSI
jgi:hypothetical protein